MRFSVGLFASLAAQAVFAAPALVSTKTPSVVAVALSAVGDAQGTVDTESADLSMYFSSWSPPTPTPCPILHPPVTATRLWLKLSFRIRDQYADKSYTRIRQLHQCGRRALHQYEPPQHRERRPGH